MCGYTPRDIAFRCAQSDNGSATTSNLRHHMKTHAVFIRQNITALVYVLRRALFEW